MSPSIEVGEARVLAVEAALDAGAGDEEAGGLAVVGAGAGVFRDAAAELGEGHEHDALVVALLLEVGEEGFQTRRRAVLTGGRGS